MTTYIIINSIIYIFTLGLVFYSVYSIRKIKNKETSEGQPTTGTPQFDLVIYLLLISALLLIIIAFFAPFIFTRPSINTDFNFKETGQIGDTIGGLMNPFIAIAGVITTGLAFYIQYKANLQQRDLFIQEQAESKRQIQLQIDNQNRQNQIQQFESQFYEMLKLHRENITEMKIEGYDFEETDVKKLKKIAKVTEGRKVFVTMKTEFECVLALYREDKKLNKEKFRKCYELFFSGLDEYEKKHPDENVMIDLFRQARKQHETPELKKIKTNLERKEFLPYVQLYFNYKPFSGHSSRLGHYFRHLYLTVKSIVNSTIITDYEEKMKYLRILRAQLSNHEQILLFYNWLGDYGTDWENEERAFFTEYCMIHNLWYDGLFKDSFIDEKVNYLRTKKVKWRKDKMFEID